MNPVIHIGIESLGWSIGHSYVISLSSTFVVELLQREALLSSDTRLMNVIEKESGLEVV